MSPSIEEIGGLRWQLVVCHIVGWIIVALCLIKGVKSSGKVGKFSIALPHQTTYLHCFVINVEFHKLFSEHYKCLIPCFQVIYVTATVPYIFLTALLIRGVMLPGSMKGIDFYVKPNWSRLGDLTVRLVAR